MDALGYSVLRASGAKCRRQLPEEVTEFHMVTFDCRISAICGIRNSAELPMFMLCE
jgi:hypothetical protein